eukprot:4355099-Alexandrium_andersonii.AAC.1
MAPGSSHRAVRLTSGGPPGAPHPGKGRQGPRGAPGLTRRWPSPLTWRRAHRWSAGRTSRRPAS